MTWPIGITNNKLIVYEEQGGTRGTTYAYILQDPVSKRLVHIGNISVFKRIEIGRSRGGRLRRYRYEADIDRLAEKLGPKLKLYMFSYSNSGYIYGQEYTIDLEKKSISERPIDVGSFVDYDFGTIGPELKWINRYMKYVPSMINEIKNIVGKLGIELMFAGHAIRLENIYNNPRIGLINALVQPVWQARQKALDVYVRTVHELYVMLLTAYAVNGKTVYHYRSDSGKPYWWIEYASDIPTAVVEAPGGAKYTFWFQFSVRNWWDVIRDRWLKAMMDLPTSSARRFVRPDIVIFKGEYMCRNDLVRRPPEKVLLIDAKTSLSRQDIVQLREYVSNFIQEFGDVVDYVVACLESIPVSYEKLLRDIGYHVVENVYPDGSGVEIFKKMIRQILFA